MVRKGGNTVQYELIYLDRLRKDHNHARPIRKASVAGRLCLSLGKPGPQRGNRGQVWKRRFRSGAVCAKITNTDRTRRDSYKLPGLLITVYMYEVL